MEINVCRLKRFMEKLKKLTSMGYLTYGSAVTPKDILLSPYRLWSDTGMLDIKTWGCCV